MKYLQLFAPTSPDITFGTVNFDTYVNLLAENFVFAILFFFGIMVFAFMCYYSFCIFYLFLSRFIGYSYHSKHHEFQNEESVSLEL